MKKWLTLLVFAATATTLSCTDDPEKERSILDTPDPVITEKSSSSFTVEWKPVDHAVRYEWDMEDRSGETDIASLSFENLTRDTYRLKLRALPENPRTYSASEWATLEITLAPDAEGGRFHIETEFTGNLELSITITPDDEHTPYYREAMDDATFQSWGGKAEDAWQGALDYYKEIFGEGAFDFVKSQSAETYSIDCPRYEDYIHIMAAYIDEELNRLSDVEETKIYTGDVPPSDNRFEVSFEEITSSSAVAYVTPTNQDPYTMILMESAQIADMSDDELRNTIKTTYEGYINNNRIYSGSMSMTYKESTLKPGRKYTLLVFGWNTVPSTDIFRYEFQTNDAADSDGLTFDIFAEVTGPTEIHVRITPSDPNAYYFAHVFTPEEMEQYKDDPSQYILDVCKNNGNIPVDTYVEMFGIVGSIDRIWNDFDNGIEPGTEYTLWAVGLNRKDGNIEFYEPQFYDKPLITPEN